MNAKKIAFTVMLLLPLVAFVSHIVITRPTDTALFFYPLEAFGVKRKITCTANPPVWLRDLLKFSVDNNKSLANQIAYLNPLGVLHHCENGWADKLKGIPVSAHHRFRFASITKVITADLILHLIDEGKISLDTRLVDIFPDIKPVYDKRINHIKIGHLLDHSAGFDRTGPEGDIMFFSAKKNWCPYSLQSLSKERLRFTPGEKQIYSNLGYCLLGAVIEKVTDTPYREYAEKIEQLSELSLQYVDTAYLSDEVRYDFRFDPQHDETYTQSYDMKALSSAAGLSGSAVSLAKLIKKILVRPGFNRLMAPHVERCAEKTSKECYAFAFNHYQESVELKLYIHSGYLPGSSSSLVVDSQGGILVLLSAGTPINIYETNQVLYGKINNYLMKEYGL